MTRLNSILPNGRPRETHSQAGAPRAQEARHPPPRGAQPQQLQVGIRSAISRPLTPRVSASGSSRANWVRDACTPSGAVPKTQSLDTSRAPSPAAGCRRRIHAPNLMRRDTRPRLALAQWPTDAWSPPRGTASACPSSRAVSQRHSSLPPAVAGVAAPRLCARACTVKRTENSHRAMSAQRGYGRKPCAWRDSVQSAWPPGLPSNDRHSAPESSITLANTGSACAELSRARPARQRMHPQPEPCGSSHASGGKYMSRRSSTPRGRGGYLARLRAFKGERRRA